MPEKATSLFVLLALFCQFSSTYTDDGKHVSKRTRILVFGGNGLMGSATVTKLAALPEGAELYLVNRGNWYWDAEERVKPLAARNFVCDRSSPLSECQELAQFVQDRSVYFDFVIDFSALSGRHIDEALGVLGSTFVGLYVYVSSDSVYEVSVQGNPNAASLEGDAVRPKLDETRKQLNERDQYGNGKLEGEEALTRHRKNGGPPFVALRFPDVIGPRDNTYRFWMTHILLNLHTFLMKPLHVPDDSFKMSFVYSEDVGNLIYSIVNFPDSTAFFDGAFNVAWPEPVSMRELYSSVAAFLPIGKPFKLETESGDGKKLHFYPSVTRGPVDPSRALSTFRWAPTEWTKAIGDTVAFYKEASSKFPDQFRRALRGLSGILDAETLQKAAAGVYTVELSTGGCIDLHPNCALWAVMGECDANPDWMKPNCLESCGSCHLLEAAMSEREKRDSVVKDEL